MKFKCNCIYCQRNTYLWKLDNGIIWIEIPKNASYNLKQNRFQFDSLQPYEAQPYSKIHKIEKIDTKVDKRAFVIIRNPIERFKSLISHYFISGMRVHFGKIWLNSLGISECNNSNIIQIVLDNWDKIAYIAEPHHLNSQSSFIPDEFFEISHIVYDVSEVSLMFGLETGVNSSDSSMINLTKEQILKIQNIYNQDIDLYEKYIQNK